MDRVPRESQVCLGLQYSVGFHLFWLSFKEDYCLCLGSGYGIAFECLGITAGVLAFSCFPPF